MRKGHLVREITNNSMRNGLKKQQLASGYRLISATHEMVVAKFSSRELADS